MATKKEVPTMVDVLDGEYVAFKEWVCHRRSKNYIARITGTHPKFKFNREFLSHTTIDGKACFERKQFTSGGIFEIKFIYFTGSGYSEPTINGLYKFNGTEFEPITEEQALKELKGNNELERLKEEQSQLMARLAVIEERIRQLETAEIQ
jgi:hypothetical protein